MEKEATYENKFRNVQMLSKASKVFAYLENLYGDRWREYRYRFENNRLNNDPGTFPLQLNMEMDNRCNLKCIHCSYGMPEEEFKTKLDDVMSFDEYKRIIDNASEGGLSALDMNTLNEPLLMKDIVERIRYAKEKGVMDILMNTNGTMLTEKKSRELVDSGLTRLLVSLDAYTEETYNKVRIGSNYSKVMKNIETFLEIRGNRPLPLLRMSFVRIKINQHEVTDFVKFWEGRADMVAIQEYLPMSNCKEHLEQICNDEVFDDDDYFCTDPWTRLNIRANGNVLPCCATQLFPNYVLGNIKESSISELWNGERMKSLRKTVFTQDESTRSEMCKQCRLFK